MKIIRGKRAGQVVKLHQWANDWMTADTDDGKPIVVKPSMVEVEGDERQRLQDDYALYLNGDRHHAGFFWRIWELRADGRFARRPEGL